MPLEEIFSSDLAWRKWCHQIFSNVTNVKCKQMKWIYKWFTAASNGSKACQLVQKRRAGPAGWQYPALMYSYPIWNQFVVTCPVLTVASWPAYIQILIKSTITWLWVYQKQDCAEWAKLNRVCLYKRKHQRDSSAGLEEARCHVVRSPPGWDWE